MGSSVAQAFFQNCHNNTKKVLDLIAPEKLPAPCFTIQIDERKIASLMHNEIIKANVHDNILEIGESILERFRKQIEDELQDKIQKQSEEKFHLYEAKQRQKAKQKSQEIHEKYKSYMKTVQKEIQNQIEIEWTNVTAQWVKNMQKAVVQERIKVTHEMMQKMRIEIAYVIQSLYKEFEKSFFARKESMIADFNEIMRNVYLKLDVEKKEFEKKVGKDFYIQKRQLEMQSTADIINIHCLEQLRFCKEKHILHEYFQKEIKGMHASIVRLNNVISVMRSEIINCHMERILLEEQFCEVIKQFQKFIDFAFCAVSGQTEYLLPPGLQRLISLNKNNNKEKNNERNYEKNL